MSKANLLDKEGMMKTPKILWFIGLVLVTAICFAVANHYHPSEWLILPAIFLGICGVLFLVVMLLTSHGLHKKAKVELGEKVSFSKAVKLLLPSFLLVGLSMFLFIYIGLS